jgi:hypothetical protein
MMVTQPIGQVSGRGAFAYASFLVDHADEHGVVLLEECDLSIAESGGGGAMPGDRFWPYPALYWPCLRLTALADCSEWLGDLSKNFNSQQLVKL